MSELIAINLTDAEILLLDDYVLNDEARVVVERVKRRQRAAAKMASLTPKQAAFVSDVVEEARRNGKLIYRHLAITKCYVCGRQDGYWPVTRSTKYKRKGQIDYDKPKTFGAVDLKESFVRISGTTSLGCCDDCFEAVKPFLIAELASVQAEVPELVAGEKPRFKKFDNMVCSRCGWEGHEGEMLRERVVMGDGSYPCGCPNCPARDNMFNIEIKRRDGFTVVEMSEYVTPGRVAYAHR